MNKLQLILYTDTLNPQKKSSVVFNQIYLNNICILQDGIKYTETEDLKYK